MVINTLQYDALYTQRHINTLQYDARYIQRRINTLQYDARYTQRRINTLQYDARYTQRQNASNVISEYFRKKDILFSLFATTCHTLKGNALRIFFSTISYRQIKAKPDCQRYDP